MQARSEEMFSLRSLLKSAAIILILTFVSLLMLLFTHAMAPIQKLFLPNFVQFASLLYPIHGLRVIVTWLFSWRAVIYLFLSGLLISLIGNVFGFPFIYNEIHPCLLFVSSASVFLALVILSKFNYYLPRKIADINKKTWRQFIWLGFLSSSISASGQSLVLFYREGVAVNFELVATFMIGDTLGTAICLFALVYAHRALTRVYKSIKVE